MLQYAGKEIGANPCDYLEMRLYAVAGMGEISNWI